MFSSRPVLSISRVISQEFRAGFRYYVQLPACTIYNQGHILGIQSRFQVLCSAPCMYYLYPGSYPRNSEQVLSAPSMYYLYPGSYPRNSEQVLDIMFSSRHVLSLSRVISQEFRAGFRYNVQLPACTIISRVISQEFRAGFRYILQLPACTIYIQGHILGIQSRFQVLCNYFQLPACTILTHGVISQEFREGFQWRK